jgi:hypothetical protein
MTADLHASAYLADGTDVAATGVTLTHDGAGLWNGLAENVGLETFPGADGGGIVGGTYPPFIHSTMYTVRGASFADVWAKIVALRRRCKPGRTVTLMRQMPDPDGTDANTLHTAAARRLTDRPVWIGATAATLDIDWEIVDGVWHGPTTNIASAAGAHTILGDTRTRRMTITLPAGAARTLMNNTNGFYVQFLATVPAGGVLIDVEARTATAITGGADLSSALAWGKSALMQLEAGSNTLALDAGSASIDYYPAYL